MNKTIGVILGVALLLIVVVPVLAAQLLPEVSREWVAARLDEMDYEEVQFYNEAQALQLAGILFVPEGEGPFPAVVFVHGSGPGSRENRWNLTIAQHLVENGVLVLIPDKRGSGDSEGDWESASFADLGTDVVTAVNYLNGRSDLPISHVGIIGNSQGGHITPLIASQSDAVEFVINLSGTAVSIREQLIYEETHNLRKMGFLPGISDLLAYPAAWSIREVRQKTLWDAIGDFDPLPYWQEIKVPALVLYGAEDTNIPAVKSEAMLQNLGNDNISVFLFEESGHGLETPIGKGNNVIRQEALDKILSFILGI